MVNRRASATQRLVNMHIQVTEGQKDFLDNLNEPASAFIRKIISAQMDGHAAELSKLKEKKQQHEAALHIINAQISELETETNRQQNAIEIKENLVNSQVNDLYLTLKMADGQLSKVKDGIASRTKGINQKLNGSGAEPVTADEITQKLTIKAKAEGLELW